MPPACPGPAEPAEPGVAQALERPGARRLARQVLQQQLGAVEAARWLALPRAARGAQRVSFSHQTGASLLALCERGAIGVDLVDLDGLALASQQDLVATAALYLGPDGAAAVAAAPLASEARIRFGLRWAGLEAKLKCLGHELGEWRPALDRSLSTTDVVQVQVVDRNAQASRRWIGCVAWTAPSLARGKPAGRDSSLPLASIFNTTEPWCIRTWFVGASASTGVGGCGTAEAPAGVRSGSGCLPERAAGARCGVGDTQAAARDGG